jgi:predicted transposase YdaD
MATKKVFKTMFEVREEKAELRGELKSLRKGIFLSLKTASLTDAQIALELDIDESFVKSVRQEFMASQQQA